MLAEVDPDDIHFRIVRLPPPTPLNLTDAKLTYEVAGEVHHGEGSVTAELQRLSASMVYDDSKSGKFLLDRRGAGRIIKPEDLGVLRGGSPEGEWAAHGAFVNRVHYDPDLRPLADFHLNDVVLKGSSAEPVAFTRHVFYGPRLTFLIRALWTPISSTEARADRTEERAFDRRITLRDLRNDKNDETCATAVVYDGSPLQDAEYQSVWLAASVHAGARLQSTVMETYDARGTLIERRYRPGVAASAPGHPPFHYHYAPYPRGTFGTLCERIAGQLESKFPIDVIIAHLHDTNDGTIERCMQSGLFAIHAASEAWNRLYERTVIIDKAQWTWLRRWVAAAARGVADAFSVALGESVENSVLNANNTSTGSRLRLFCAKMRLPYKAKTKKAIDLRNKLFHDGYLQRRFSSLDDGEAQERYDDLQRIREFTLRMVFACCDMDVRVHSFVNLYESIESRDRDSP